PRIYPFADIRDAGALLQRAGFAMPVVDVEDVIIRYNTMFDLMYDLRAMGMQNALISRSRRFVSKRFFFLANEIYAKKFSDSDGRIRASFSFLWLSGW
ncbi:MAG: methyltransferase, partial [Bartonella sp.]|nr:methyltransferase [Bartonella sp.]